MCDVERLPALRQVWFGCTKIAPLFCAIKSAIFLFSGRWIYLVIYSLTFRLFLDIADLTFGLAFLGCVLRFWSAVFFAPAAQRGRCPHALRAPLQGKTLLKKGYSLDPFLRLLVCATESFCFSFVLAVSLRFERCLFHAELASA